MKSGWTIRKLGEVCGRIVDGDHNPPSGIERSDYLMLSSKNILDGTLNFDNPRYLSKNDFELTTQRTNVRNGDVLLTIVGTIGRCCVFTGDRPVALQRSVAVLKPRNDLVESRFLMFSLQTLSRVLEEKGHGAAQKGLYLRELAAVEIPIPSLPEQKRIVAKIDAAFEKIDKLKANAERNLANAKELFQSALDEAMRPKKGWVEKRLGEVCEIKAGGDKPYHFSKLETDDLRIPVVSNGIENDGVCGFTKDAATFSNCITISARGTIGWPCIRRYEFVPIVRLITAVPKSNVVLEYLYFLILSIPLKHSGTSIPQLTVPMLRDVKVCLAAESEQKSIVRRLEALAEKTKRLEENYTRQIADCAEMRQSVLREAFEGRL